MTTDAQTDAQFVAPSLGLKLLILSGGPAVTLAISGVSVALPKIEAALAHSDQDKFLVKMLIGIVGAAMVIGAPLTGFLADRFGLRRVLFTNYLFFLLAGTAGLYLNSLEGLVLARFVLGVAGAGAVTSSIIIINQKLAPQHRAQWMGGYIAMAFIGAIVVFPLAGFLAERNWHLTFLIYLYGLPLALLALTSIPPGIAPAPAASTLGTAEEEKLLSWIPYSLMLLGLLIGCISYLPTIYTPFILAKMDIGPKMISMVLLGETLTGTFMALLFGRSQRYFSPSGAFAVAYLTTGIGGVITGLATNYWGVFVGMAFIGLGTGWFMPNLMMVLGGRVKVHQQGRAAGIVKGVTYLSTPVCILLTERLSQLYGPRIPLLIAGALSFTLFALEIYKKRSVQGMLGRPWFESKGGVQSDLSTPDGSHLRLVPRDPL